METSFKYLSRICLALLLAGLSVGQAVAKSGTAIAKTVVGSASYIDQNGATRPLAVGTVLEEGWTVQTGPGASVDLALEHNGPYVGLFADTTVKLSRLRYEPGVLGEITETELNVPRGQILAHVNKLLAGSRYEVISPRMTGKVRGTDFYWSSITGEIHTITGLVQVFLTLVADLAPNDTNDPIPNPPPKIINVPAGLSLFIPQQIQVSTFLASGITPSLRQDLFRSQ